ncbi:MAG: hypothetical protein ACRCY4_08315 [Brevinema sp.]
MKYFQLFCLLLISSCSLTSPESLEALDVPIRPESGYQRSLYLTPYISFWQNATEEFPTRLTRRGRWIAQNPTAFTSLSPNFSLGFNFFQNTGTKTRFSFAERLFFADVFDMIRFVVNSPVFEEQMLAGTFFENDGVTHRPAKTIVEEIKKINFSISLAKRTLDVNVLAEATVGGFSYIVWVRDDVDYSKEQIQVMALVILHEITHNLGYFHSSGVNFGVHDPLREAIRLATATQVTNYISVTPYYEDRVISKVRTLITDPSRASQSVGPEVSCTFDDIFGHNH